MNLFFPVSITISMVITTMLFEHAAAAHTVFARSADTFLATMMALAILEHWFLVIPLPAGKLWQWGLASRRPSKMFDAEIIAGFLGAGKTTFLQRRLAELAALPGKTVVLVNDFASFGIDGSLLNGQGADVVELPNGCICCSLRDDLARQLEETVSRFAPDRVLIEPSGVADIASLIGVMRRPGLAPFLKDLTISTVIDAGAFLQDYAKLPAHFAAQARLASTLIINKADTVPAAERLAVAETLRRLNPAVKIVTARYGHVDAEPVAAPRIALVHDAAQHEHHEHHHDHEHEHHHDHAAEELGFTAWHTELPLSCEAEALHALLDAIAAQKFGDIKRVKGIVKSGAGWLRFDLAGGLTSIAAFAAAASETPRVVAIGAGIDQAALAAAFTACTIKRAA
jgi:G3E family GTPase